MSFKSFVISDVRKEEERKIDGDGYIRAYLGTFRIFQVLVMMIVVVKDVWRQCYVAISHLARKRLLSLQLHLLVVGAKIRGWGEKKSSFNQCRTR